MMFLDIFGKKTLFPFRRAIPKTFIGSRLILLFCLIFSSNIWSIEKYKDSFEKEMGEQVPLLISELISKGLNFPLFKNDQPFWNQMSNPEPFTDIGSFYKSYDRIMLDQIEINYFHYRLSQLRQVGFLEAYLEAKFAPEKKVQSFGTHLEQSPPVRQFFAYLEEKDLKGLKDFMQKNKFSNFDKTLVAIFLIHTKEFSTQIMDFIQDDLSLSINQELKNEGFIYREKFDFLEHGTALTSLAHELLVTGDLNLMNQLFENKNVDWLARNFLGETFIHFFMRSDVLNDSVNLKLQADIMEKLLYELYFLFKERDVLGLDPFLLAFHSDHFILMKLVMELWAKLPDTEQKALLEGRDNYGRNVLDILFYNGNTDKTSGIDWLDYLNREMENLSVDRRGSLYVNEELRPRRINALPYVRISPFFLFYKEHFRNLLVGGGEPEHQNLLYMESFPIEAIEVVEVESNKQIQILLNEMVQITDFLEKLRQSTLSVLLAVPPILSIVSAIQQKDKKALINLSEKEKEYLNLFINLREGGGEYQIFLDQESLPYYEAEQASYLTHFLNEAIINTSLPAVEYLLDNHFNTKWFKRFVQREFDLEFENMRDKSVQFVVVPHKNRKPQLNLGKNLSFLIDPLSLALLTYASLPQHSENKENAKQIIRLLSNYQDPGSHFKTTIRSSPMSWALSLGLLDVVKFFHEEKGVEIPERLAIDVGDLESGILMVKDTSFALEVGSFMGLSEYVTKKSEEETGYLSSCEGVFLH